MAGSNEIKSFRAAALIGKYLRKQLTESEKDELADWLTVDERNRQLFRELSSLRVLEEDLEKFTRTDLEAGWERVQNRIREKAICRKKPTLSRIWLQSAAAILVLAFAIWQFRHHSPAGPSGKESLISRYGGDVLPGSARAELILGDGTSVKLDAANDSTFMENGSSIQRTAAGALVYAKSETNEEVAWNNIRIPNGGEYKVVLEDGTKIWLNAASSLRYPIRFTGKERRVELISGEAYFEIAKNKEKPFIVITNRMEVQAVGTEFDINTYGRSDSSVSATLTEGKVLVKTKTRNSYLHPGEQLAVDETTERVLRPDMEEVTAWKNGLFLFNGTDLLEVMQQISRWYDVQIMYDRSFRRNKFFTGEIKRNVPVSKLLGMMELTGIAKFKIEGNTIIISAGSP
jgi:ferric-dicitrate binding protein FerR (iron transport regulator)